MVVRYNRAGKWRIEPWGDRPGITLSLPNLFATIEGEGVRIWYPDRPGGSVFDKSLTHYYRKYLRLKNMVGTMKVRGAPAASGTQQ